MKVINYERMMQLRGKRSMLWDGGPPPSNSQYAIRIKDFVAEFAAQLALRPAMQASGFDYQDFQMLCGCSPWFCEQINGIIEVAEIDVVASAVSRAAGRLATDEEGNTVRVGASDSLAKYFMEQHGLPALAFDDAAASSLPPLLPSNVNQHRQMQIDDCHMALNALRPAVRAGDRQAIDSFTKVQDRLAKLQGTDAAVKKQVTYDKGGLQRLSDDELYALAAQDVTLLKGQDGIFRPDE